MTRPTPCPLNQEQHGTEEAARIKERFDTLMRTYGFHPAATDMDPPLRAAIAASAILEVPRPCVGVWFQCLVSVFSVGFAV